MTVVLAIDQGTTGTKVLAIDRSGRVIGRAYREIGQHYPRPGWVEHDPEEIWRSVRDAADQALAAFEWFLGRNDLGEALYDPASGGCRDGLHADRVNQNQGAESTLAFLLASLEMRAAEQEAAASGTGLAIPAATFGPAGATAAGSIPRREGW